MASVIILKPEGYASDEVDGATTDEIQREVSRQAKAVRKRTGEMVDGQSNNKDLEAQCVHENLGHYREDSALRWTRIRSIMA